MTTATQTSNVLRLQVLLLRARVLMTRLNLYYAGVGLLALINLYLLVQIVFVWRAVDSRNEVALEQQTVVMKAAQIATKPLEGLDGKLANATTDSDQFYTKRLPEAYSEVLGELGILTKQQGVKLSRVQYADSPVLDGAVGALTEVRMDASLSGDYRPLVLFINSLERDKMFFLIRGVTLTGQQSGTVGLRLSLTTFLRTGKESVATIKPQSPSAAGTAGGNEVQ